MALLSKKKLIPMLIEAGFIDDDKGVSYEAYGRKVFAYVRMKDHSTRRSAEAFLRAKGVNASQSYSPLGATAEIPVSYFKAWHWDE